MSSDQALDVFTGTSTEAPGNGVAGWWRRNRGSLVIALLLVGALALTVATSRGGGGGRLAVDNPAPDGGRALAQVLAERGVEVRASERLADVVDTAGPGTTVLVLESALLDPERLQTLRGTGADLVLVQPGLPVLQILAPELTVAGSPDTVEAEPGCDDPDAVAAGSVRAGGRIYTTSAGSGPVPGVEGEEASAMADVVICYPSEEGDAGSYAVVDDPAQERRVVVHGQGELLTNQFLAEGGNSALALRSLGANPTLIWYTVDPLDVAEASESAPTASELLPSWVRWVVAQLGLVLLVAVLWRSRRLGRLVPERLPVVVRSAEVTEGRARLYRSAGARGTSAALLRVAGVRRLAGRLGARTGASAEAVAVAAASATGRDPTQVLGLLAGPDPHDDAGLIRLADDIDTLEREVADR